MKKEFHIILSSDLEYEQLCAEIYYKDLFVAILIQEEGFENLEIEIYPPTNAKKWVFKYSEFLRVLEEAKQVLKKMKKS